MEACKDLVCNVEELGEEVTKLKDLVEKVSMCKTDVTPIGEMFLSLSAMSSLAVGWTLHPPLPPFHGQNEK